MFQIIGPISPPPVHPNYLNTQPGQAIFTFISVIFKIAATIGGVFVLIQFIMAGFDYMTAAGDEKKVANAWNKIWQSILGLVIISGAFVLARVVERITGINIINPEISGP